MTHACFFLVTRIRTQTTDFSRPASKTCDKSRSKIIITQDTRISAYSHTIHNNRKKANYRENAPSLWQSGERETFLLTPLNIAHTPATSAQPKKDRQTAQSSFVDAGEIGRRRGRRRGWASLGTGEVWDWRGLIPIPNSQQLLVKRTQKNPPTPQRSIHV